MTSDLDTRPTFGFEILKGRMQELLSVAVMTLRHRVDVCSGRATTMFFQLTQYLNRAMGHDAIDLLKRWVVEQGVPLFFCPLCQSCPLYTGVDAENCFVPMHKGQD